MATTKSTSGTGNPMFDMDMTKMFGDYQKMMTDMKVPGMDMEGIMAMQKKNIEALTAANKLAFEGLQAVAQRQQQIMTQMMEEAKSTIGDMMAQGAPEEKVTKQIDTFKATFEKSLANMKEISEMMAKSNTEAADVITKRMTDMMDEMKTVTKK